MCGLVLTDGGDEDEAVAALLHDALEIVGVVDNVLKEGLDKAPEPEFYVPLRDPIWGEILLLVRRRETQASSHRPSADRS